MFSALYAFAFLGFKLRKLLSSFSDHFYSPYRVLVNVFLVVLFLPRKLFVIGKNSQIRSPVSKKTFVQNPMSISSPTVQGFVRPCPFARTGWLLAQQPSSRFRVPCSGLRVNPFFCFLREFLHNFTITFPKKFLKFFFEFFHLKSF